MRYRRVVLAVAAACLLCAPAIAKEQPVSWRKPNNSYPQFVQDSVVCAKLGYFRDVANDEPAKAFVRGWQTSDDNLNAATSQTASRAEDWADAQRRTQPARRMQQVQALHVNDVEQCLTQKGYIKFVLSENQEKQLSKYRRGSEDRRRYLYELSTK
jgi:hypothetical protein